MRSLEKMDMFELWKLWRYLYMPSRDTPAPLPLSLTSHIHVNV